MDDFHTRVVTEQVATFAQFIERTSQLDHKWIYRGLAFDWHLKTSLERTLATWRIAQTRAPSLEQWLILEFIRRQDSHDIGAIGGNTCYCLSLMQHHGAPTRFQDWTYSPYIAAKFALDCRGAEKRPVVVWCLNTEWMRRVAADSAPSELLDKWDRDRDEETFKQLFMPDKDRRKFIFSANPVPLNQRLRIQQGLFLCQGDISASFVGNLSAMGGWDSGQCIRRLKMELDGKELYEFAERLPRMNIDSASLFPGFDGLCKSLGERLFIHR
jgi:hypothetical protein